MKNKNVFVKLKFPLYLSPINTKEQTVLELFNRVVKFFIRGGTVVETQQILR